MTPTDNQRKLAEMILASNFTVALTGAGISTPSGIPDFRSPGGLWTQVNPMEVAHIDVFDEDPVRFWEFYKERLDIPNTYEPNAAHYALAELEVMSLLKGIITQNIDGLHEKAGSSEVTEIHGSVRTLSCRHGETYTRQEADVFFSNDGVPYCPTHPEQALKPDVVLFGEMLPQQAVDRSYFLAYRCDLIICLGSSLTVYPVAELPMYAKAGDAKLVIVTRESALDEVADLHLSGDIAEEMEGVITAVRELKQSSV